MVHTGTGNKDIFRKVDHTNIADMNVQEFVYILTARHWKCKSSTSKTSCSTGSTKNSNLYKGTKKSITGFSQT